MQGRSFEFSSRKVYCTSREPCQTCDGMPPVTNSFCIDSVIFSVTLVLTVMIVAADPTVKNITAQYVFHSKTSRT